MQFMEPLGATDGSVEAAWDHLLDQWREDVVEITRELGPPMMRWGGIFSDFYRWREGVGPRDTRPSMLNLLRSEEHTSELQSRLHLVCRLLLEKQNHSGHD